MTFHSTQNHLVSLEIYNTVGILPVSNKIFNFQVDLVEIDVADSEPLLMRKIKNKLF